VRAEVAILLPTLRERGDHLGITKALQLLAFDHSHDGHYRREAEVLDEALDHARMANDRLEQAEILTSRVDSIWRGPTPVAQAILECDTIVADPSVDRRTEAIAETTKALLVAMLGRFDEARSMAARAHSIQLELGLHYSWFETAAAMSTIEWLAGDPAASERVLRRRESEAPSEDETLVAGHDALLVRALCGQGRFEEARILTERPPVVGGLVWARILLGSGRGRLLAARGEHDEAEAAARGAAEIAAETDSPGLLGEATLELAHVLLASGRRTAAAAAAGEAATLFDTKGDVASRRRASDLAEAIRGGA
jgi:tetratricopeptide (TPR) repeat protein